MTLYSYIVKHDNGFAPNPFHGFCTLACCKPEYSPHCPKRRLHSRPRPQSAWGTAWFMPCRWLTPWNSRTTGSRTVSASSVPTSRRAGKWPPETTSTTPGTTGEWQQERSLHSLENGEQDWKETPKRHRRQEGAHRRGLHLLGRRRSTPPRKPGGPHRGAERTRAKPMNNISPISSGGSRTRKRGAAWGSQPMDCALLPERNRASAGSAADSSPATARSTRLCVAMLPSNARDRVRNRNE